MSDVDLVVAGAGGAGLVAALAATERGASVVLLEAMPTFRHDCNTAMSTAMVPAAGSRWQAEAGIDDRPDKFYDDVMRKTGGLGHPVVTRALVDVAPDLVTWLADSAGVPLELVTDFLYPGHSVHRCHTVGDRSGRTLHGLLLAAVRDAGVNIVAPMRLTDVVIEDERVVGARVANPDGVEDVVSADAVVLATNGFGADRALVERHIPEIAGATYYGGQGSKGDALRIGARLGADTACLDAYQGHGSLATPHGVLLTWASMMHGGVIVDADGLRFADETIGYSEFATLVIDRPGAHAWAVFDERIDTLVSSFADHRQLAEAGGLRRAVGISELATIIRCDPSVLENTLADAHAAATGLRRDGEGAVHSRIDGVGRRWSEQPPVPPFVAVKITGALFHTQGGLVVDGAAAVTRGGTPIPGLYAAGGAAVGMSGVGAAGYMAGNGLLSALGLGYLAGRAATDGGSGNRV